MHRKITAGLAAAAVVAAGTVGGVLLTGDPAGAATTISTPKTPAGWSVDNRPGGTGGYGSPSYSGAQPRNGNGSLLFDTPTEDDGVAVYHVANVPLSQVTEASYEYLKVSTGQATFAPAYVLKIDADGNTTTTDDVRSAVYEPTLQRGGTPGAGCNGNLHPEVGVWLQANVRTGCLWDTADQVAKPYSEVVADFPAGRVIAYGISQGSGNGNTRAYADSVSLNGNSTNFELDTPATVVVTVTQQGRKSAPFNHYGDPARGSATLTAWVDIERTATTNNAGTTYEYRVRSHARLAEVSKVARTQLTLRRLGAPGRVLVDDASVSTSGTSDPAVADDAGPYVPVNPGSACPDPVSLQSRGTGDVRWTDNAVSQALTVLSDPTASKVCLIS